MTIEELEEIARQFIIGYVPLNEKQKGILIDIRQMEEQREALNRRIDRYDKVIQLLYIQLTEVPSTTEGGTPP